MKNTTLFVILGFLLFGGMYFLIASEYATAKLDTLQKVVSAVFFATFIVGIYWGASRKPKV